MWLFAIALVIAAVGVAACTVPFGITFGAPLLLLAAVGAWARWFERLPRVPGRPAGLANGAAVLGLAVMAVPPIVLAPSIHWMVLSAQRADVGWRAVAAIRNGLVVSVLAGLAGGALQVAAARWRTGRSPKAWGLLVLLGACFGPMAVAMMWAISLVWPLTD